MFFTCFRKELLQNMVSARYLLVFALFVCVPFAATVVRTHVYKRHLQDYQEAAGERHAVMRMAIRSWQSTGLGVTVEAAPNPTSIFAGGLENEITRSYNISQWTEPRTGDRKLWNPSFRYLLNLDMVLIVNIVCSLLAVLLVFDAIAGERERGTLKVLLAGPIPRDTIISAKLLAGLVTVIVPLVLAWLLGLLYAALVNRVQFTPDHYLRLGLVALVSIVYISLFFALGIAASAWAQRSATALAACIFAWVVFVLVAPNSIPLVVNRLAPIPAASKILAEKSAIDSDIMNNLVPVWRDELRKSGKYARDSDMQEAMDQRWNEEQDKRFAKLDRFYNSQVQHQIRLNQSISRFSPSAAFVYASTQCAGTGVQDFVHMLDEVSTYVRQYQDEVREQDRKRDKNPKRDENWSFVDSYDPLVWPKFDPQRLSAATALNRCWLDLVVMTGAAAFLFLLAFVGFMRYDAR
jgi:ABC-type transport system involved in multi-copper enzyme maturation permease subunit